MLLQQAVNALTLGSLYALIAIGLAITFSILDVVNFAQGSLVMWGAYLGVVFAVALGLGLWVPIFAALVLVGLLGILLERTALYPLRLRQAPRSGGLAQVHANVGTRRRGGVELGRASEVPQPPCGVIDP